MQRVLLIDRSAQVVGDALRKVATLKPVSSEERARAWKLGYTQGRLMEVTPIPSREEELRWCVYWYMHNGECSSITIPPEFNDAFWNNLKDWYHPNGASLVTCAREFLALNRDLADPLDARSFCWTESCHFQKLLCERRVITSAQLKSGEVGVDTVFFGEDDPEFGRPVHHWFRYRHIVIDWTYRQFDHQSPFPLICWVWNYRWKPNCHKAAKWYERQPIAVPLPA